MKVRFDTTRKTLERHVADAEVVFEGHGPMRRLSLAGFAVWAGSDARPGLWVSLPQGSYLKDGETRRFNFLRGDERDLRNLKATILGELVRQHPELVAGLVGMERLPGGIT